MNPDPYRLRPLPPRKKSLWQILFFGVVAILLISIITFTLLNQHYMCEMVGGTWIPYPLSEEYENSIARPAPTSENHKRMNSDRGKCFDTYWWVNK